MFNLSEVSVCLKNRKLLDNINLAINANELTCIIGPNGAGKSTLMKTMLNELNGVQGGVFFNHKPLADYSLTELSKVRAYLAQAERCVFDLKVYEYLMLAREHHTESNSQTIEWINEVCNKVGILRLLNESILSLSGGEFQLVNFARAYLQLASHTGLDNTIMLLDEPTSALDIKQAHYFYQLIKQYIAQGGTAIVIEHDINLAGQFSDSLALIKQGRLLGYQSTRNAFTKTNLDECFGCYGRILQSTESNLYYSIS